MKINFNFAAISAEWILQYFWGFSTLFNGSASHSAHPRGGHRSQRFPLEFLQCSHFFQYFRFWNLSGVTAENSTNSHCASVRVPRLSVKAELFYLLFFTPLQVPGRCVRHQSKCQIFPQTLVFLSDKMHFFLLHFQAVASSLKIQHICDNFK